ncbi:MAG: TIGR01244 family phosphatase [Burkholderiaceae bacterium]|jgi:uncharacterized protein (TIGR01244 family)|nr:TIGR01244 family phosphatase [Burkholderiaceae bacterium]
MLRLKTFALSVLFGAFVTCAAAQQQLATSRLTDDIQVSGQILPEHMEALKNQGIRTVIDLRPDGETPDEPSSSALAQAARQAGLQFGYVPVPLSGNVPSAAVDTLGELLARVPQPVLMYCRSGMRATKTWALAEASRPGGLDAAAILQHARDAGRPVDSLSEQIAQRIAARIQH